MPASRLALASLAALALAACDDAPAADPAPVRVRLHGDGRIGQACEAQSQCGFRQRCVYRGKDARVKGLEVEAGRCEADRWPGGCFALLPMHPYSKAERAARRAKGHEGLPVHAICH